MKSFYSVIARLFAYVAFLGSLPGLLYEISSNQNTSSLCIINLPSSFSENYSKLIDLNCPKIYHFEDHKIFETYFFNKKNLSSQIITMPISEKDLLTRIYICFYQSNLQNENIKEEKVINQGLLQIDTEKYEK